MKIEAEVSPDPLGIVPDPTTVHRRLCELTREEALLRRLLRLALAAKQERVRRAEMFQEGGTADEQ